MIIVGKFFLFLDHNYNTPIQIYWKFAVCRGCSALATELGKET